MSVATPYTRAEIEQLAGSLPSRGVYCPKCENYIPSFSDLTDAEVELLKQEPPIKIIKTLRDRTGCSLAWAKLWVIHRDGPHQPDTTTPCPYCAVPLHPNAKQCILCKMNWHDQLQPISTGTSIAQQILDAPSHSAIHVRGYGIYKLASDFVKINRPNDELTIEYQRKITSTDLDR